MPQISVIVPVYNSEQYLHRCIDSILAQTFTDFELLLIDDGSTDKSGVICDEYVLKDKRVRVFHKENGGVSSARNVGLDHARGKYIGWVDSDDYIHEDMFQLLYEAVIREDADIAYCNSNKFNMPVDSIDIVEFLKQYWFLPVNPLWNTLCKRKLYHNLRFSCNANIAEDLLMTTKLYYYAHSRILVSKPLYYYRYVSNSLSNNDNERFSIEYLNNVLSLYEFFRNKDIFKQLEAVLACRILLAKQFLLYVKKDISEWYSICTWSHKYIFNNRYNGLKGKIIEYTIANIYKTCLRIVSIKI